MRLLLSVMLLCFIIGVFLVIKNLLNHATSIPMEVASQYPHSLCLDFKDSILK